MTHQFHLARAAVWQSERERKRRKVAAWHTLWELGQAREALRRMGEVLPEPERRSREAFADAIYRLANESFDDDLTVLAGQGHEGSGPDVQRAASNADLDSTPTTVPSHLQLLDGGLEDSAPSARGGAAAGRDQSRMGGQPLRVATEQPGAHPRNFETEEQV